MSIPSQLFHQRADGVTEWHEVAAVRKPHLNEIYWPIGQSGYAPTKAHSGRYDHAALIVDIHEPPSGYRFTGELHDEHKPGPYGVTCQALVYLDGLARYCHKMLPQSNAIGQPIVELVAPKRYRAVLVDQGPVNPMEGGNLAGFIAHEDADFIAYEGRWLRIESMEKVDE